MTKARHTPRKRFGQHFLIDHQVLDRIISVLNPDHDQYIVEIGPGLGALTESLVESAAHLTVVELDRDLADRLRQRYSAERVNVVQADVLQFNLADAFAHCGESVRLRVVGNLPYNISTPLIFHLLEQIELIQDMLFMLQREVADRLVAGPGSRSYGRLTIMASLALDCEMLFDVPPQAFHPPPKVNSSVIRLTPKKNPLRPKNPKLFKQLIAAAFSQRRKTVQNSLKAYLKRENFSAAGVDPSLRAEALRAQDFALLTEEIERTRNGDQRD